MSKLALQVTGLGNLGMAILNVRLLAGYELYCKAGPALLRTHEHTKAIESHSACSCRKTFATLRPLGGSSQVPVWIDRRCVCV